MDHPPRRHDVEVFTNEQPYRFAIGATNSWGEQPAEAFPIITDLRIEPVVRPDGLFGVQMRWASAEFGVVAVFPWWDDLQRDLLKYVPSGVPFGTREDPFVDIAMDWGFEAWEDGDHIYVVHDTGPGWNTWYRVPKARFLAAWTDGTERITSTIPPPAPG
jgi:hypothetical protein